MVVYGGEGSCCTKIFCFPSMVHANNSRNLKTGSNHSFWLQVAKYKGVPNFTIFGNLTRRGHKSCKIISKGCGKDFSLPNSIFQSCKAHLKFSNVQKMNKNWIITPILTQINHFQHFFIIPHFSKVFKKNAIFCDFSWFSEKLGLKFF